MRALWSDRQNCSHNVSQKVKHIRRLSGHFLGHPKHQGFLPLPSPENSEKKQRISKHQEFGTYLVWSDQGSLQNTKEWKIRALAHQNRTIAVASDFRVDGAESPEILQKQGVLGSDIAARNRKWLATFHRTLKSQCSIACSFSEIAAISGVRDGHRNRKSQKSLRFRGAKVRAKNLKKTIVPWRSFLPGRLIQDI